MPLLSSADYPDIRAQLDVTLSSTMLPDNVIALDGFIGAGQRAVLLADPLAESRTGDDLARVKLAAVKLTAASIAPRLPQVISEEFEGQNYRLATIDLSDLADRLRSEAYAEIATVLDADDTTSDLRPTMFSVGKRCR